MKKDLLITFAAGDAYVNSLDCRLFLQSLEKFSYFEKACIVKDISEETRAYLRRYFDHIVDPVRRVGIVINDRHMSYYEFLASRALDYEHVMHVDFRDVILQKNPFDFMRKNPDRDLFLVSEGMTVGESYCNQMFMEVLTGSLYNHKYDYHNNQVVNGGTFGGKTSAFMQLCLLVASNTNRLSKSKQIVCDQGILLWLYPQMRINPFVKICDPHDSEFCATGEGIKYGHVDVRYDEDNKVLMQDNSPYYIFHQWDRTSIADKIRNKI